MVGRALACAFVLVTGSAARAQTTGMSGTGSCTGDLAGTVGLAFQDSGGTFQSVQAASIPTVFGNAECQCQSMDLNLEIQLTRALPLGRLGTVEVWVGTSCDMYPARLQPGARCEQVGTRDISEFVTGSSSNRIHIPINAAALFSPNAARSCTIASSNNAVWIFLYTDVSNPFAKCTLQLNEVNQGPSPPINVSAGSGDSAVTISWQPPTATQTQPYAFQILCAQGDSPISSRHADAIYSTCLPGGVLQRRKLLTGGALPTTTPDGGTRSLSSGDLVPLQQAGDGGVSDGGTDGGVALGPFATLDVQFICSNPQLVSGNSYSQRISGLKNGTAYQFVVLAIDTYGNATPSPVVTATPLAVEDLYRRYHNAGGRAHGFCFIATAAWGSYEHRFVHVLRDFRDRVLLPSAAGAAFVDWYYAHSPGAAAYIAARPAARVATQLVLWPVIGLSFAWLYAGAWLKALVLVLLCALVMRRILRGAR